jgi:hypothetical protein
MTLFACSSSDSKNSTLSTGIPTQASPGSDLIEMRTPDPSRPSIVVGSRPDANSIGAFFGQAARAGIVQQLMSLHAKSGMARAWVSSDATVRAVAITFSSATDAKTFREGPVVEATPDTPRCTSPTGWPVGCLSYPASETSKSGYRGSFLWSVGPVATSLVVDAPTKQEMLALVDEYAQTLGAPVPPPQAG